MMACTQADHCGISFIPHRVRDHPENPAAAISLCPEAINRHLSLRDNFFIRASRLLAELRVCLLSRYTTRNGLRPRKYLAPC
jgi:hypothetical protein